MAQKWIGSPNYTSGRQGKKVTGFIIHWIVGNLASADAVFQNKSRNTSAHYGIENGEVHQYVKDEDTAYHAGHWDTNLTTIGIEHSAQPGREASDSTYESSAALIASLMKKFGIGASLRPHNVIVATQCPGTVDVNRLVKRANELYGGSAPAPTPQPTPAQPGKETVKVAVDVLYVRSAPTRSAPLAGSQRLNKGDTFEITERVKGENVDGVSTWVKSTKGNYVWAGGLVGQTSPPVAPGLRQSGVVVVTAQPFLNVRTGPGSNYPIATNPSIPQGRLMPGTQVQFVAAQRGQNVNGNDVWLKSVRGNWFWAGGTNY